VDTDGQLSSLAKPEVVKENLGLALGCWEDSGWFYAWAFTVIRAPPGIDRRRRCRTTAGRVCGSIWISGAASGVGQQNRARIGVATCHKVGDAAGSSTVAEQPTLSRPGHKRGKSRQCQHQLIAAGFAVGEARGSRRHTRLEPLNMRGASS